jgi:hypothetical protein
VPEGHGEVVCGATVGVAPAVRLPRAGEGEAVAQALPEGVPPARTPPVGLTLPVGAPLRVALPPLPLPLGDTRALRVALPAAEALREAGGEGVREDADETLPPPP